MLYLGEQWTLGDDTGSVPNKDFCGLCNDDGNVSNENYITIKTFCKNLYGGLWF